MILTMGSKSNNVSGNNDNKNNNNSNKSWQ